MQKQVERSFFFTLYIMYKEGDLKLYFKDLFSRNISTKQRKKIKHSQVKTKQRLTSVFILS